MKALFKNANLAFDIEKIESNASPITVSKFDEDMYILDVSDTGYFYVNKEDRDSDFNLLKTLMPGFNFVEY